MMELLTHGGEHHEIDGGGWLMMTMATISPLWSLKQTLDPPEEEQCLAVAPYRKMR